MRREFATLLAAATLLLGSCSDKGDEADVMPERAARSQPAASDELAHPDPHVSRRLAPIPKRCPGPRLVRRKVDRDYAPLFGKAPIFAGLYAGFVEDRNGFEADRGTPRTRYGWRSKLLWVMPLDVASLVIVTGHNIETGEPIVFELEEPEVEAVFDPASPPEPPQNPRTHEWGSYVYFPSSGCYRLEARATEGGWRWGFGFGSRAPRRG